MLKLNTMIKKNRYVVLSGEIDDSYSERKDSGSTFSQVTNEIYFYDDVTRESIFNLNRQINEVSRTLSILQSQYNLSHSPTIDLYVSSEGGDVFPAMSAVDRILNSKIPIHTRVEGSVASAATLISVVGHKRYISKNAFMLIHSVRSSFWGNFGEIQDEFKNLELIMNKIKQIYLAKTKFKESELDDILKHDLYLDAKEALKYGLVDEII
jgi:ATP-dependent Clp protease protease subunit